MSLFVLSGLLLASSAPAISGSSASSDCGDSSVRQIITAILAWQSWTCLTIIQDDIWVWFILQKEDHTNTGPDLLKIGVGILNGFLGLLQGKIALFRSILTNKVTLPQYFNKYNVIYIVQELHQAVGNTIKTGVELTTGVVSAKVGIAKTVLDVV